VRKLQGVSQCILEKVVSFHHEVEGWRKPGSECQSAVDSTEKLARFGSWEIGSKKKGNGQHLKP